MPSICTEITGKRGFTPITSPGHYRGCYLKEKHIQLKETDALLRYSGGDARKLLNILELVIAAEEGNDIEITDQKVTDRLQENPAAYDKGGEMHYDIISAFIKSIRGSDPDGAIYWLARMVAGGEDPKFIARRLCILQQKILVWQIPMPSYWPMPVSIPYRK